jgi:hypothetical protein
VHQIWRPSLTCVVIAGSDPQSGFKGSAKSKPLLFAGHVLGGWDFQKIAGQPLVGAELTLRSKVSGDQNHGWGGTNFAKQS